MTKSERNTIKAFLAIDEKLQVTHPDHKEYDELLDQYDPLLLKVFKIIARIADADAAIANLLKACINEMPGITTKQGKLR
jgi:hypothetical protein